MTGFFTSSGQALLRLAGATDGVRMATLHAMFKTYTQPMLTEISIQPQRSCRVHGIRWDVPEAIYVHKITAQRWTGVAPSLLADVWKPTEPVRASDIGSRNPLFPTPLELRAGQRLTIHVEYDGKDQSIDTRGVWLVHQDVAHNLRGASRPNVIYFGGTVPPCAAYGREVSIVLDDSVLYAKERRDGEFLAMHAEPLATTRPGAPRAIEANAAEHGFPRPIAIRQFVTPHALLGKQPYMSITSGYDDERGWMFAVGRDGSGSVMDLFPAGSHVEPAWLATWSRMSGSAKTV